MDIPSEIKVAVRTATNERDVAEATRIRDAEVWAYALTWHPSTRFKRDLKVAQRQRGKAHWLARAAVVCHGPKALRYLLDTAHRVRHTPGLVAYVSAYHQAKRILSTTTTERDD